jgi:hypothetical protein
MPTPVKVVHPAWVAFKRPRGRVVWESLIRHETDAVLRERSPKEFQKIFELPAGPAFPRGRKFFDDGTGFWELILAEDGRPAFGTDLVAYLRGDPLDWGVGEPFKHHLGGTPVAARLDDASEGSAFRGFVHDPARLGEIMDGALETASANLVRFLDESVCLVEGGVAMRCRPVMYSAHVGPGHGEWAMACRRPDHDWSGIAASADRFPTMMHLRPALDPGALAALYKWQAACAARPDPDADLAFLLNLHASPVHAFLGGIAARNKLGEAASADVEAGLKALEPIARAAQIGMAGTVDLLGDLETFARAVPLAVTHRGLSKDETDPQPLGAFVERLLQPRLQAMAMAAIPAEDFTSFRGLAP